MAWGADSGRRCDGYERGCASRPDRCLLAGVFHPPSRIDPSQGMRAAPAYWCAVLPSEELWSKVLQDNETKTGQAVLSQKR
jgi:hypothetical protein